MPPAAFRTVRSFLDQLDDLAEVTAAGGIHDDVLAEAQAGHGARVEVIDFPYFGKSYTDDVLHGRNYTVSCSKLLLNVSDKCYNFIAKTTERNTDDRTLKGGLIER